MGNRTPFNVDVRGLLDVNAQLAMLSLPPKLRRRLLNRVALRLRTPMRRRVRKQQDLDGTPFAPRRRQREDGTDKMLGGLAAKLSVARLTANEAHLGWRSRKTAIIANVHNSGMDQARTAAQMRAWSRQTPGSATERQAKRLHRLGYLVRVPSDQPVQYDRVNGKKVRRRMSKRDMRWEHPSVSWIQENLSYEQAGLLIQKLKGERRGPQSWRIRLPKREFFGIAGQREVSELIAYLLPQILNSPR